MGSVGGDGTTAVIGVVVHHGRGVVESSFWKFDPAISIRQGEIPFLFILPLVVVCL